jgi:hypothetical protein
VTHEGRFAAVTIDLTKLSPNDAVTALRSYPRRFRSAFAPIDDDEGIEEVAQQAGPDGRSAVEITADTVRTWTVLREALRQIQVSDSPVVHAAVVDPASRQWETPMRSTVTEVLDHVDDEAAALADAVAAVPGDQWHRSANVAGGGTVTALDVAREAVRVGHEGLVATEATLAALRR